MTRSLSMVMLLSWIFLHVAAGNIGMMMSCAMPVAVQSIASVLTKYGFTANLPGLMTFLQACAVHKENPELVTLLKEVTSSVVPPEAMMALAAMGMSLPGM